MQYLLFYAEIIDKNCKNCAYADLGHISGEEEYLKKNYYAMGLQLACVTGSGAKELAKGTKQKTLESFLQVQILTTVNVDYPDILHK